MFFQHFEKVITLAKMRFSDKQRAPIRYPVVFRPRVSGAVALFENFPVAPAAGAVNVTLTPESGLPPASRTVTERGVEKAVRMGALCGVAAGSAVAEAGAPAAMLKVELTTKGIAAEVATRS